MIVKLTEEFIDRYCVEKKYTVTKTPKDGYVRIDVSNLREKVPISLYDSGALVIGGSPKSTLKIEFDKLKQNISDSPEILEGMAVIKAKSCATRYNILTQEIRDNIKNELNNIEGSREFYTGPTPSEDYRLKITVSDQSISITQYKNGTLLLQGKEGSLFTQACDIIETIGRPSEQEVILRFFAFDELILEKFTLKYTPQLIEESEKQIKTNLGEEIFNFLESHDKKWFIASECLRIVNVPLPEYSPIVMPASKAFEGFLKKLLIKVGFFPSNHFDSKTASFGILNNETHATRVAFVAKDKYADTYLKKIYLSLDTNRNFLLHSDDNSTTKIDTYEEACNKLDSIYDDIKDFYEYFKTHPIFGL
jgi:hypothetical protein